jgi:hypothetical protein
LTIIKIQATEKSRYLQKKAREPALTKDMLKELGIVGLRIEAHSNGVSPGH